YINDDPTHGSEPWVSDGTLAGTHLLADVAVGTGGSAAGNFKRVGNKVWFVATDATHGTEPWISDGTAAGTTLLADIAAGAASSMAGALGRFTGVLGATLYFRANDGATGGELWKTDGTTSGTVLVKDIEVGAGSSLPQ